MTTLMAREMAEAPEACARLLENGALKDAAREWRASDPAALVTVARGSSDHACAYVGYAAAQVAGVVWASYPPSLASLHGHTPRGAGMAALAVSQSGGSPDIVAAAEALRDGGASVVALTNTPGSPLAEAIQRTVPLDAGAERAVAATKSFVASVAAGLRLVALWTGDGALADATMRLPDALSSAMAADMTETIDVLSATDRLLVLGRGPALGTAGEVALKAMELCEVPALALSGAEVRHGPMQAVKGGFPVIDLDRDAPLEGARVLPLPPRASLHPLVDPLLDVMPLYAALEAATRARGLDPDAPSRLRKVTRTL